MCEGLCVSAEVWLMYVFMETSADILQTPFVYRELDSVTLYKELQGHAKLTRILLCG